LSASWFHRTRSYFGCRLVDIRLNRILGAPKGKRINPKQNRRAMNTGNIMPGQVVNKGYRNIGFLLLDRRLAKSSIPWVIAILALANVFVLHWQKSFQEERQKNLLVNLDRSRDSGVRWDLSVGENLDRYWSFIPAVSTKKLVILAGMSQMYAINEARPQDKTISEHLDDALSGKGIRVFGMAAPNMSNEEATLLLLSSMLSDPERRVDVFIYGVCFDKFRNLDLRPGYQSFIQSRSRRRSRWVETVNEYKGKYPKASQKMAISLEEFSKKGERDDGTVEARLREWASGWFPLVSARNDLNAIVQGYLFSVRNWIFNIKPTSKRPIIEGRFDLNKEFLGMMVDLAQKNRVKIIFYVIPLNPLADNPYIPEQYTGFKNWLELFCRERGVPFTNLENVVPTEAWGDHGWTGLQALQG
jgi:hypothetical protein